VSLSLNLTEDNYVYTYSVTAGCSQKTSNSS